MEHEVSGLIFKRAKQEDLIHFDDIVEKEQFDIGLHNWELFFSLSPNDFWVLIDPKANGKIVGIFTANSLNKDFIWGQQCVILPEYRKHRRILSMIDIGFKDKSFSGMRNKYSIMAMYQYPCSFHHKQLGFSGVFTRQNARRTVRRIDPPSGVQVGKLESCPERMDQELLNNLYKYDDDLYANLPTPKRHEWFTKWLFPDVPEHSYVAIAYRPSDKSVCGYGVARLQSNFYSISPLYADSEQCAYALLHFIADNFLNDEKIYMEFHANRRSCLKFVQEAGLVHNYTSLRFYSSFVPNLPIGKLYCDNEFWPI